MTEANTNIICPHCRTRAGTRVIDSREGRGVGSTIRRRRQCVGCAGRFTTYERIDGDKGTDAAKEYLSIAADAARLAQRALALAGQNGNDAEPEYTI